MTRRQTSKKIDDLAACWAARIDRAPLSTAEKSELDLWLSADPRHLGAFAKAQAVCVHLERARALGRTFDPKRFVDNHDGVHITRRHAIVLGTALTAAAAAAAGVVIIRRKILTDGELRIVTEIGETRAVPLEDSSVVTLNTASQVVISYTARRRAVKLVQGEALFEVAKDPTRPFIVDTAVASIRAVGTSFAVLSLPQRPITVMVREGVVELDPASYRPALRLAANMRAVVPSDAPIRAMLISPAELDRELIWREGRISFEGNSLGEAAESFARYSDTRILFGDPSVAKMRITGLFVANDPIGFSRAVALSLGLHVQISDNEVELSR